jgi:hypothetical protein
MLGRTRSARNAFELREGIALVTHHGHDVDRSKSGKSKGAGTGLGQINAATFNIRPSVRDRDSNGVTIFLVGDLNFGTKGATQSSARTGMWSKQSTSAASNRRIRDPEFTWLDAPTAS